MADPAQRTVPPLSDAGIAGSRSSAAKRPLAIDAERSPEEIDLGVLADQIAGRLDEVLDEHALLRQRDEAEARHEEAVRVWTAAIARGSKGDVLRKRAMAATIQRSAGSFEIVEPEVEDESVVEPDEEAGGEPDAVGAAGASEGIDASDVDDEEGASEPSPATPLATASDVVPDVDGTDAKLLTVRRRLEGRRAVALRPPPPPTRFWHRHGVVTWTRRLLWGAAIVALSVLVSVVAL